MSSGGWVTSPIDDSSIQREMQSYQLANEFMRTVLAPTPTPAPAPAKAQVQSVAPPPAAPLTSGIEAVQSVDTSGYYGPPAYSQDTLPSPTASAPAPAPVVAPTATPGASNVVLYVALAALAAYIVGARM